MTRHFFGDVAVLLGRSLRHIGRSPDTIPPMETSSTTVRLTGGAPGAETGGGGASSAPSAAASSAR